jgi:predicted glycosyltransferase
MAQAADEKLLRRFRILVAPLDWGLGHATRCIPIIRELLANNCDVWLAGEGIQEALLRLEFPDLPFLSLAGYRIEYSKSKMGLPGKMILQIPKIISAIRKEHRWLKRMVAAHDFDVVISDNRFGLYHSKIPTVFITHQLSIKNESWKWTEKVLRRWNYNYINRFCECWVPDAPGKLNLAGELSHPAVKPNLPVKYIGLLSRFEKNVASSPFIRNKDKDHLLLILSGPEPQRSILEDKIIDEISHYNGTATVVRGLPASLSIVPSTGMIRFYNHLSAKELNEEMEKADWVIGRCGYSTVMDLVKLQKKSILVPTPGQTEQEYLAKYLEQKRIAMYVDQSNFSIGAILSNANSFDYQIPDLHSSDHLKQAVRDFLRRRE